MQRVTQAEGCRDGRMMWGRHVRDIMGRTRGHRERDSDTEGRTVTWRAGHGEQKQTISNELCKKKKEQTYKVVNGRV